VRRGTDRSTLTATEELTGLETVGDPRSTSGLYWLEGLGPILNREATTCRPTFTRVTIGPDIAKVGREDCDIHPICTKPIEAAMIDHEPVSIGVYVNEEWNSTDIADRETSKRIRSVARDLVSLLHSRRLKSDLQSGQARGQQDRITTDCEPKIGLSEVNGTRQLLVMDTGKVNLSHSIQKIRRNSVRELARISRRPCRTIQLFTARRRPLRHITSRVVLSTSSPIASTERPESLTSTRRWTSGSAKRTHGSRSLYSTIGRHGVHSLTELR
jgi:hypothetical protein